MATPFKVGIIGYGLSAKVFQIPFVNHAPDFELYALVQRSPKSDDDASKDWPSTKIYRTAEELVSDQQVQLVIITTAPVSHFDLAKLAIENGKNVLVEKPFVPTEKEARDLVELSKKHGVVLTVYQNRRLDSDFLTLQKIIEEGRLGRLVEFETHFDRHRPEVPAAGWKTVQAPGTGAVYDLGSHLIDQAVVLLGKPKRITAFVGAQRVGGGGLEDSCTVLLHYDGPEGELPEEGGILVTVKAAVVSLEEKQLRYLVRGTEGTWRKTGLDPQEDQLRKEGLQPGSDGYGIESKEGWGQLTTMNDGRVVTNAVEAVQPPTYSRFYTKLAAALRGDKDAVPVHPEQAVLVIRLIELARESSRVGKTLEV